MVHLDDPGPAAGPRRLGDVVSVVGGVVGVGPLLLGVEQLEDALGAGGARLDGGGHAAQLGQGLGELLGVLDEGLHVAQAQVAAGDHEPADHRDRHIGQVPDDLHDRHHNARQELGPQPGPVELLVLGVEPRARIGRAPVGAHQGVAGEGLLHAHVQLPGPGPLRGEGLLRARPDHAEHDAHERQDDERHQGQPPGDRQHHGHHPHHGQHGGHRAGQGLLEGVGDIVDVVGEAAEELAALDAVEVGQGQAVDLGLDVGAQPVHRPDHRPVEDEPLEPGQQGRGRVDRQGEEQDAPQSREVDALPGHQVHGADHVCHIAVARGGHGLDRLLLGRARRQEGADGALEDDIGGAPQDLGGGHGQHDGGHGGEPGHRELEFEGGQEGDHPGEGGPEGVGPARGRAGAPVVRGGAGARGRGELLLVGIDGGGRGGVGGAHTKASLPSWEMTISR